MSTVCTQQNWSVFFEEESPPTDLEDRVELVKYFSEKNIKEGRSIVLVSVRCWQPYTFPVFIRTSH